jgi:hypothetical protein
MAGVPAMFSTPLLLIEHDLDLIRAFCSVVAVGRLGSLVVRDVSPRWNPAGW